MFAAALIILFSSIAVECVDHRYLQNGQQAASYPAYARSYYAGDYYENPNPKYNNVRSYKPNPPDWSIIDGGIYRPYGYEEEDYNTQGSTYGGYGQGGSYIAKYYQNGGYAHPYNHYGSSEV